MCVHCEVAYTHPSFGHLYPQSDLIDYHATGDEPTINVYISGSKLVAYSECEHKPYSSEMQVDINFCPMCGRDLRGGER